MVLYITKEDIFHMKTYYRMTVAGVTRDLPICKLNDELCIAGFVIFGDPELTVATAAELLKKAPPYDYLLTAEAKGIPLIHEMARQNGDAKYFLARKKAKLYMQEVFSVEDKSITTEGDQTLYLAKSDADMMRGKNILIVDDVVSTGGSLRALEHLVEVAGGNICGRMTILAEGDAISREDLIYLEELPLFDKEGEPLK
jgi:adenine phosphoribosyltransferase